MIRFISDYPSLCVEKLQYLVLPWNLCKEPMLGDRTWKALDEIQWVDEDLLIFF